MFTYIEHSWSYFLVLLSKWFPSKKPRQLKGTWTLETAEELRSSYGIDIEQELMDVLNEDFAKQVDKQVLEELRKK